MSDQGERGTCLAFAVTAAHELARAAGSRGIEDLSEEALYWGCKQVDGDHAPGTRFDSAATALETWGQPPEELWPYDPARSDKGPLYAPPAGALDPPACRKARLRQLGATTSDIKFSLAQGRAVALGILLSRGFINTPDGRIPVPGDADLLNEGHAVLAVGYEDGESPGDERLIVRNSWGPGWGDNGYGYLPYAYIERAGLAAWIAEPEG